MGRTAVGLEPLLALAGVDHVSLADDDGAVIDQRGGDAGDAGLVLGWGRDVRAVSRARVHELEDLMITSTSAYHLLRRVPVDGAEPAWVYVRVGRAEGNLALTRRRLAALALHDRASARVPQPPAAQLPAAQAAAPAPPVEESPAAGPPSDGPPGDAPPADAAAPLPQRRPGALLPPGSRRSGAAGTATAATTATTATPTPARGASAAALFEPVVPGVAPALSPYPATGLLGAVPTAPPPSPPPPPPPPAVSPTPPAPVAGSAAPATIPEPRVTPEARTPAPRRPAAPRTGPAHRAAPAPDPATGWATDLTVMRRLLAGLRRLV